MSSAYSTSRSHFRSGGRAVLYCFVVAAALLFPGCTKYVAGPKGEPGTAGSNGTLIQTVQGPFTIRASGWTWNNYAWVADVSAPAVTENVMNGGEVKVYMKDNGEWRSLPHAVGNVFTQM